MRKAVLIGFLIGFVLLMGCKNVTSTVGGKTEVTSVGLSLNESEYPRVDGSTATLPLAIALRQAVTGCTQKEAEAATVFNKTSEAYRNLISEDTYNKADLLIVYAAPKEVQDELDKSPIKIIKTPIGRDALVFITNNANPVSNLTTKQIQDIYTGKTTNWKTLGGQDKTIAAFQRPESSGSQALVRSLVMKKLTMVKAPSGFYPSEMEGLINALLSYDNSANSIGYSVYYYASEMYKKPGLKFISVNGIEPNKTTIKDKTYPFINDFYVCIRKDTLKSSATYKLYEWLTGAHSKQLVESTGYVSVK